MMNQFFIYIYIENGWKSPNIHLYIKWLAFPANLEFEMLDFFCEIGRENPETLQETMSRKLARWAMKLTDAGILGLLNHCTKLQSLCVAAIAFSVRRNSWFPLIGGIYIIYTPTYNILPSGGLYASYPPFMGTRKNH